MVGFWSVLKCFWPKKVNSWKGAVLDQKGTESLANMLTLSPTVRKLWEKCYLALKPISIFEEEAETDLGVSLALNETQGSRWEDFSVPWCISRLLY